MSANLAINTNSEKTDAPDCQQTLPAPSKLRVLGEIHVRHEAVYGDFGRIRFQCEALRDELELSRVLCQELVNLPGVKSARVNTWSGALIIVFDIHILSRDQLVSHLGQISLACNDFPNDQSALVVRPRILQSIHNFVAPLLNFLERIFPATINLFLSSATLACSLLGAPAALTRTLLYVSIVPIGLRAANTFLIEGKIGVDALDGIAAGLMAANGKTKEACFMTALISLGEYIRERTSIHCRKMVDDLLSLSGRSAWLVKGRKRVCIPVDQVKVGDLLVVYPGELIPVDGTITEGQASIDQSKLTGEAIPVEVNAGDQVYAATILLEGKIYIRCLSVGTDTKAGTILQSLKSAPIHETKIQNYAALTADKLVLPIIFAATLCFIFTRNPMRMISILIFDFSTGIRIAAPTAVLSSMYNAGRKGILVKNGAA